MPRALEQQVAVVVGASSGIGRATALRFGRSGTAVVAAARNNEALGTLVDEIRREGGRAVAVPTDVTDYGQVQALARAAVDSYGRIDTWVNVAAVTIYGAVEQMTVEEFRRVVDVNFMGHVHGVYAALPELRRSGGGVIIGVSSVIGVRSVPLQAPYAASKWALRGFYDALRMELQHDEAGIAVTTILPASVDTPLFAHARSKLGTKPAPPPPVYAPEVVAKAIVRAAEHPTREVVVGGAGTAFLLAQRVAPALSDRLFVLGSVIYRAQRANEPDDGVDNIDAPVPGPGSVRGEFDGHVARTSLFTSLVGQRPVVTRALEIGTGLFVLRRLRRSG